MLGKQEKPSDSTSPESSHHRIAANFAQLEQVIYSILLAHTVYGKYGTQDAVLANRNTLDEAQEWLPDFFNKTKAGWLLRQRAENYQKKGESAITSLLDSDTISQHIPSDSNILETGSELSTAQFMTVLTIGMLYNKKSISYQDLQRGTSQIYSSDVATVKSFWMFNWQPETVFDQLQWLAGTGHWMLNTPVELATKYHHQFLKFGHFVSAFIRVNQEKVDSMKQVLQPSESEDDLDSNPSTYTGSVPASFRELIDDLDLE